MYIELFGLPGAGKTTYADFWNKVKNRDSDQRWNPFVLIKICLTFVAFFLVLLFQMIISPGFLFRIIKRPIHFGGFMKGILVRFIVLFQHQHSGYFISDHGVVQTLSQSDVIRKEMKKDLKFISRLMSIMPHVTYVYLKPTLSTSKERTLKRDKGQDFSEQFLLDSMIVFRQAERYLKPQVILTNKSNNVIIKQLKKIL